MQSIKHKHDTGTLAQAVWGFGLVLMVVIGICGTIYKLLSPAGWIAGLLGSGYSGGVAAGGLMLIFGAIGWMSRTFTSVRQQSSSADFVVYVFAAAGLLYAFQYWNRGVF